MNDFFSQAETWARANDISPPLMWMAVGAFLVLALRSLLSRRKDDDAADGGVLPGPRSEPRPAHTVSATFTSGSGPGASRSAFQVTQNGMRMDIPPETAAKIDGHLSRGQKIEAIKEFRAATGVGLAEAKSCIEALERAREMLE